MPTDDLGTNNISRSGRAPSARTRVNRGKKRATYDRDDLIAIIDDAYLCHASFMVDSQPVVLPTCYGRLEDTLYIHGSPMATLIKATTTGLPVCVCITHLDGLVMARSAFHHSANYRSVVIYGVARLVDEPDEKIAALRALTEQVCPGRWEAVRPPSPKELELTSVVAIPLTEMSGKVRSGPPVDDAADYAAGIWAGELPMATTFRQPVADPKMTSSIEVPRHIHALISSKKPRA